MVTYHSVKFYVSIIIHLEVININVRNFNFPIGFYSNPNPLSSPKNLGEILVPIYKNAGRFSKTFTAEILVQTAKYCLPQITYLLIHVFLINFRQVQYEYTSKEIIISLIRS
jgi:hypothetical protein